MIYKSNLSVFKKEDDISFYLLGAYMTDGHIDCNNRHNSFKITSSDRDWLIKIGDLLCPSKPIYKKGINCFSLEISNLEIVNWLVSYGCKSRKSLDLFLEKEIPLQFQRDFVRGVVDGDGSISKSRYRKLKDRKEYFYEKVSVYICSASECFLKQTSLMIPSEIKYNLLKIKPQIGRANGKSIIGNHPMYRLAFNDSYAKKFLAWCYYDENKIALPRKLSKVKEILKN